MKNVTVRVPANLTLQQSQQVLASVLQKTGHPNCLSGQNIYFENAVDPENSVLAVEKTTLNVKEVGG
jgi:hypothetical protein